jgi:hypothetical protein
LIVEEGKKIVKMKGKVEGNGTEENEHNKAVKNMRGIANREREIRKMNREILVEEEKTREKPMKGES